MNFFERILSWPKRKWRSGGFGIHSPFAFGMITRCLNDGGEYYAYDELRKFVYDHPGRGVKPTSAAAAKNFKDAALLFRLVCRLQPEVALFSSLSNSDFLVEAVRLADSRIVLADNLSAGTANAIVAFNGKSAEEDVSLAKKLLKVNDSSKRLAFFVPRPYGARGRELMKLLAPVIANSQVFISPRAAIICYPHPTPELHKLVF